MKNPDLQALAPKAPYLASGRVQEEPSAFRREKEVKLRYSRGVRRGNLLFIAGSGAVDDNGEVVGVGDIRAQFRQIYKNIGDVLAQFGADSSAVVDETMYVVDSPLAAGAGEAARLERNAFYGEHCDIAATMVHLSPMTNPDLLCEVKCIAYLDESTSQT
jgi:2-iminobutanoate/2-iminopropanoate deaminase